MKRAMMVPVALGLLFGACDNFFVSDPDDVFLRTDRTGYAPGDTVLLRLVNEAGEPIGYNLCLHDIQRDDDGTWTDTDYHLTTCTMDRHGLANGASAVFERPLPADMPPDVYRFRTSFWLDEDEHDVSSRSFVVE